MDALIDRLKKLNNPPETSYIKGLRETIFDNNCKYSLDEYKAILENNNNDPILRFSAFYCLFLDYRRFEKRYDLMSLVEHYLKNELTKKKQLSYLVYIVQSQYRKIRYLVNSDKEDYRKALEYAEKAIGEYNSNRTNDIGCFNNFADIVLDSIREKGTIDNLDVNTAMRHVNTAINIRENERNLPPYANYYCSKARLFLYQKNYPEANDMINLAISYEKTDNRDSMARLSNYHNVQLEIKTKEILSELETQVINVKDEYKEIHQKMDQQQVRYIEILGFFSAIIALIIGAISISLSTKDFRAASASIMILSGGLILGYIVLKILFSDHQKTGKVVFSILIAVFMIIFAILQGKGII